MTVMSTFYKGVQFSAANEREACALYRCINRFSWGAVKWDIRAMMPGHELVMLLKLLAARDKAQVFVLPGLKPARSFEETFSTQTVLRNEWIKKFARDCGKPIL